MKKFFYLLVISFLTAWAPVLKAGDYWTGFQYPDEAKNYVYSAMLDGDRLFLGTIGQGLFYTDDMGKNWTKFQYDNFKYVTIHDVLFGPAGELYCVTDDQLYKTGDFGKNWDVINFFEGNGEVIKSASINPQGTIAVGTDKGVYISDSSLGGLQWVSIQTGHKNFITDKVIIDHLNNVFVSGWAEGSYSIFLTDIYGQSFGETTGGITCGIDSANFARNQNGNVFLSVKSCIYMFNNAKRNWEEIGQTQDERAKRLLLSSDGIIALYNNDDINLYDPKTRVLVRNPGINDTTKKYIVDVLIRPTGEVIVANPDEGEESTVACGVLVTIYLPQRFRVLDARGTTIRNATVAFYKGDCDTNYRLLRTVTTDNNGIFSLATSYYGMSPGDKFRLSSGWYYYGAPKPNHADVENKISAIELNNLKFDDHGVPSYQTLTTDTLQDIVLDHQLIGLYLTASIEWDAKREYLDSLEFAIRVASRDLFDITDGQLYIKKIAFYDNKRYWDDCDIRIHAETEGTPCATVGGAHRAESRAKILTPRRWLANNEATNFYCHQYGWVNFPYWQTYGETVAHELGHYWFGFWDEYVWTSTTIARPSYNYGFMDDQYLWSGNHRGSEMSTANQYTNPNTRYTAQWRNNSTDCWSFFKQNVETDRVVGTTPNVLFKIFKPSERTLAPGYDYLIGPVDIMTSQAGCDVTRTMTVYLYDAVTGAGEVYLHLSSSGVFVPGATVTLRRNSTPGAAPIVQGKTNRNGDICVVGAKVGDVIFFDGSTCPNTAYRRSTATWNVTGVETAVKKGDIALSSIELELQPLNSDVSFVNTWKYDNNENLDISLFTDKAMSMAPKSEIITEQKTYNYDFNYGDKFSAYYANIPESALLTNLMTYSLYDNSSIEYFSSVYYDIFDMSGDLISSDRKTEITLDTVSQQFSKIAVLSSNLVTLLNGLPDGTEQVGPVVSITSYPQELSSQNNSLRITYGSVKLENGDETTLSLYLWNELNLKWEKVESIVDTAYKYVMGNISSSGTYAIFTTVPAGINEQDNFKSFGLLVEPNPTTGIVELNFNLQRESKVNIDLFDALGMKLITICDNRLNAGVHNYKLDCEPFADGIYFLRLSDGLHSETVKLILTK